MEEFARALPAGAVLDKLTLRDHARQILEAICKDLAHAQSREQRILKSKGLAPPLDANQIAAQTRAILRARNGFDINALAAEYRALWASVLHLWFDLCSPDELDLKELMRFNEAIDQALCESISFFSAEVERARNLLLGVLGHDMRTPLSAIQMTAHYLKKLNAGQNVSVAASRLIRSGAAIKGLLDDLTEFNRTQLGLGISLRPTETSLSQAFDEQLQQIRIAYPEANIEFHSAGDLYGLWDARRLQQLLGNLLVNALKYGESTKPIRVELTGLPDEITFRVGNQGKGLF